MSIITQMFTDLPTYLQIGFVTTCVWGGVITATGLLKNGLNPNAEDVEQG